MAEILHQLRLVVYPVFYKVLYIPGGAGFLNHQQSQAAVFLSIGGRTKKPVNQYEGIEPYEASPMHIMDDMVFCRKKILAQTPWQSWRMKI